MITFILAAEGQTDIDALTVLLKKFVDQCHTECTFAPPIFPSGDATAGRGWSGLKTCLEAFRGTEAKTEEQSRKDIAIYASMGMRPPSRFGKPRWPALFALYENLLPVIHLDGDIAEEIGTHHPQGAFSAEDDRAEYCRKALQHWTNLTDDDAIWCVPVQCLETWFLALHPLDDCKKHMPGVAGYESTPNQTVYDLLCCLGHPSYFDADKRCNTVDKIQLTQTHTQTLADNLDTLCAHCPSAQRFADDIAARLTA